MSMSLLAFFFNIQEWSRDAQKLFLFSDHHIETDPINQRTELIDIAKQMNAYVVVEDHLEPNGIANLDVSVWNKLKAGVGFADAVKAITIKAFLAAIYKDCYEKISGGGIHGNINYDPNTDYSHLLPASFVTIANQRVTPLACLTQFCRQNQIATTSIEFRFYVTLSDVIERHEKAIKELYRYHDGYILDTYYQQIINSPLNVRIAQALKTIIRGNPFMDCSTFINNDSLYNNLFDSLYEDAAAHFFLDVDTLSTEKKLLTEKPYSNANSIHIKRLKSLISQYFQPLAHVAC